jgi:hypothetical protein
MLLKINLIDQRLRRLVALGDSGRKKYGEPCEVNKKERRQQK